MKTFYILFLFSFILLSCERHPTINHVIINEDYYYKILKTTQLYDINKLLYFIDFNDHHGGVYFGKELKYHDFHSFQIAQDQDFKKINSYIIFIVSNSINQLYRGKYYYVIYWTIDNKVIKRGHFYDSITGEGGSGFLEIRNLYILTPSEAVEYFTNKYSINTEVVEPIEAVYLKTSFWVQLESFWFYKIKFIKNVSINNHINKEYYISPFVLKTNKNEKPSDYNYSLIIFPNYTSRCYFIDNKGEMTPLNR